MEKSKIMIFQKKPRLTNKKYSFTIGDTLFNHVTCFNYLGRTISASGQFDLAIKHLTDKARRAYYTIRKSLFKFNPSIKLWLKIFDSIIKPIFLYGCEIWGPKFKLNYKSWDKNPLKFSTSSSARTSWDSTETPLVSVAEQNLQSGNINARSIFLTKFVPSLMTPALDDYF